MIKCANTTGKKAGSIRALIPIQIKDTFYMDEKNSFSSAKAELGRYLFYDRRLSANRTKSCASCHAREFSFTDSYNRSIGAFGDLHQRNSKPLINLIFNKYLTAADSSLHFPEQQIVNPMMNDHPLEMGIKGNEAAILNHLREDDYYINSFQKVFPEDMDPFTIQNITACITTFIKTILSFDSPYDQYKLKNIEDAMNESQRRGMRLFLSAALKCSSCHGGINFCDPSVINERGNIDYYFNTGLYNISDSGYYPPYDQGLIEYTKNPADMGKYLVPTLRNLAFTAPYFHDGSAQTLEEVIAIYENGGRDLTKGEFAGDGRVNQLKNPLISGFKLNQQERKDLISFLFSLSDSSVLTNKAYANPFKEDETSIKKSF